MARLILKCPYLKGGKAAAHLSHLVKYIATREGVEKVPNPRAHWHSTKNQADLVAQIIREFPDSRESLEYEDYLADPSRENASEFITMALEQHMDKIGGRGKYLDYIANRPRVEKMGAHGLFTGSDEPLVLSQVAKEVSEHTGNVWTPIISLRRGDAAAFGFESAAEWKALLSSKATEIAESLKIHPDHLKWYAAFHDQSHHPHVHMICYSTDPKEGYLTKTGIRKMKSALVTEIFRQELIPLYAEKTQRRDALTDQSRMALRELLARMSTGTLRNKKIERLLTHLAECLRRTTGKKQYGYLKADLKNVVDEIVDELARDERVSEAYRLWREVKGQINQVYSDQASEPLPLSQCEDFKSIRNLVIKEAAGLADGTLTFEEPDATNADLPEPTVEDDTPPTLSEDDAPAPPIEAEYATQRRGARSGGGKRPSWWTDAYKQAKQSLFGDEDAGIPQDFERARALLLAEAERKNPLAMCDLGRMSADGLGAEPDGDAACQWYAKALAAFLAAEAASPWKYTQYRIGKMYAAGIGTEQNYKTAAHWLTLSADENYKYAEYSLGGLYDRGNGVEQKHQTAFTLYTRAADQGFPYASFELGKMLRDGVGCIKSSADSEKRFAEAFQGFTSLEARGHDDKLQYRLGWMLQNGVGTEKDMEKAKRYLEKSASVGNLFACYQLAKIILTDAAAPREVEKALNYMRQAVEAENPHAQYSLGKLYEEGQHVPRNIAEAVRLYKLSAEQDNDCAAYRLGKLYLGGEGILKNVDEALRWLNFAADRKNQFAEYALGSLCQKGEAVPKDMAKALDFLQRAAARENQYAQYRLGKIYLTGEDAPKDIERAVRYLTASADQGNQFAQYTLGKLYLLGGNVPKDKETAVKWFTLATAQGNLYAQFFLDHIDEFKDPSVMLSATKLLHHMSRVIGDTAPARMTPNPLIDRKRLQKLREKKQAQGHARDDHEQSMSL